MPGHRHGVCKVGMRPASANSNTEVPCTAGAKDRRSLASLRRATAMTCHCSGSVHTQPASHTFRSVRRPFQSTQPAARCMQLQSASTSPAQLRGVRRLILLQPSPLYPRPALGPAFSPGTTVNADGRWGIYQGDVTAAEPALLCGSGRRRQPRCQPALQVRASDAAMMEAPSTQGRGGDTLVKKNTVLVVGGTGTLGRQVLRIRGQSAARPLLPCPGPDVWRMLRVRCCCPAVSSLGLSPEC